jgi:hypothetical protein
MHLVAVGDTIPDQNLLGRAPFYSHPDEERSGAVLMRSWSQRGLDVDALPEARQPVHVFQSACASVQQRAGRDPKTGQRIAVLTNEVKHDDRVCSYQITVRRWAGDVIEHDKTMTVVFDKRTNRIDVAELDDFDPAWGGLAQAIQAHFDANAKTVPGQKIRNAIRQTILDIGGQNLRRKAGGLYFVPVIVPGTDVPTLPILEGLKGVVEDLYGDRGDFHWFNCANNEGEREIVRKHFALNANEKAEELRDKAWKTLKADRTRGVRSDVIANLENERRALLGQIKHFEQLVNLERSSVQASIDELDEALEKLDELANAPKP